MTTEWCGLGFGDEAEHRTTAVFRWTKVKTGFFVRKMMLEPPYRQLLEDEAISLLLSVDDEELLTLDFHKDLLMDDVMLAELMKGYSLRARVSLSDVPLRSVTCVDGLLNAILHKMDFDARCHSVCEQEIAMHKRGLFVFVPFTFIHLLFCAVQV
jgi:hypothetical protein